MKNIVSTSRPRSLTVKALLSGMLVLLLLFVSAHPASARDADPWIYGRETDTGSDLWSFLEQNDEVFREGTAYEPLMCLARGGGISSWLVEKRSSAGSVTDGAGSVPDGYFVMYVLLEPYPRIVRVLPVGTPLEPVPPSCEVKLLLDSSLALDGDRLLSTQLRELFQTGDTYEPISVMYLDTDDRAFLAGGWVNRIRLKEGKTKYTLTYKKRYPVQNEDTESALAAALKDGFSLYDADYPAEIDWSYSSMVLSFSYEYDIKKVEKPDLGLLEDSTAAGMIAEHIPTKEARWDFAQGDGASLSDVRPVGPIRFLRYSGSLGKQDIRIEIWPIPDRDGVLYVTEFSFTCDTLEEAAGVRTEAIAILDELGILIRGDSLKTQLILMGPEGTEAFPPVP